VSFGITLGSGVVVFNADRPEDLPDDATLKALADKAIKEAFTPKGVEQQIKQAVILCWLIQPENQRNYEHVKRDFERAADKVLSDLRADPKVFGVMDLPACPGPDFDPSQLDE
jgi:hypothetical protein